VIAAVEGVAYGGGLELALVADIIVAARDARLGALEVKVGLFPGGGALLKLPRFMPYGKVAEMAMAGVPITADEAHGYGLVTRLTDPGASLAEALDLARAIAANAPLGVAATKQILQWQGMTVDELWDEQNELVRSVFSSADAREGSIAFAERRPPQWQAR
jgi:enoyl-CoA hydratase